MVASPDSVFQSLDNGDSPLELLMVGSTAEDASRCANALRNSGQPVRMESTETREGLMRLLETEPADLVTINADSTTLPPDIAIEMIREENPAAAIILLSENPPAWADYARESGVRDLLHSISIGRLIFAIQREYRTLLLRQELARTRHRLANAEQRFQKLLKSSRDAIAYIHQGLHIQSNAVYRELFGLSAEDMESLTMTDLIAPEDRNTFKRVLRQAAEKVVQQRLRCRHSDGNEFEAELELQPLEVNDEPCVQVLIRTGSTRGELQARIQQLIDRDPHTQLLNRNAFVRALERIQSEGNLSENTLLMKISIDNFAELCDDEGLDKGDLLLKKTAEMLQADFGGDLLSRFGDHEFLVLTHSNNSPDQVAERCLELLTQGALQEQCELAEPPEFSLGAITCSQASNLSALELVRRCRRASRSVRSEGDNNSEPISVYNDLDLEETVAPEVDTEIVGLIDGALEHDGFRLLYQPLVSLEGDTRENYSVFVRLLDENGVEREPAWFYQHADRSERLSEIDRWVIRRAIGELSRHRNIGRKVNFHITLSRDGALDDSMLLWVCDCLREFKAKGAWLYFQFDVALLQERPPGLMRFIEGLHKINCQISCSGVKDDFSDIELFEHYRVSLVRLSPELSRDMVSNAEHQDRFARLNNRLQEAGFKTAATGIEDANTLAVLWNMSVNYIQGYFLQEPAPQIDAADKD